MCMLSQHWSSQVQLQCYAQKTPFPYSQTQPHHTFPQWPVSLDRRAVEYRCPSYGWVPSGLLFTLCTLISCGSLCWLTPTARRFSGEEWVMHWSGSIRIPWPSEFLDPSWTIHWTPLEGASLEEGFSVHLLEWQFYFIGPHWCPMFCIFNKISVVLKLPVIRIRVDK